MRSPLSRITVSAGVALAGVALLASVAGPAAAQKKCDPSVSQRFSFGVMADTQWTNPPGDDGRNPNTVAVDIINQLNAQFIAKHVKFVVQAGDLVDKQSTASIDTTAAFRQALYNAGIGFYPLRGNHENSAATGLEFLRVFPQTQTAQMNATPSNAFTLANVDPGQPVPAVSGSPFAVGSISASPAAPAGFTGLDYAFDYGNARFVLLDQFTPTTGVAHTSLDQSQVDWMKAQLAGRPAGTHAFVFGHKGIITENHVDTLFTDDKNLGPAGGPTLSNAFIQDLQDNGVRYYMGGHDHMHNRALVKSVDGKAQVEDITLASDSSKFYIPYGTAGYDKRSYDSTTKKVTTSGTVTTADPTQTNDYLFDVTVAGGSTRETEISQDLYKVGYYIFKVNGPRVTVEYWAADPSATLVAAEGEYQITTTPSLVFKKMETYGYSLNGKQFLVPEGKPYTDVKDSFAGTNASIIAGVNGSTATDTAGRALTKTVDTGWSSDSQRDELGSSILTLWGLTDLGAASSDSYVLSMSYGSRQGRGEHGGPGTLVTQIDSGRWVNAVATNDGGKAQFVLGPYKSGYKLGTYGVDVRSRTAWAVVNHEGSFAIDRHIDR